MKVRRCSVAAALLVVLASEAGLAQRLDPVAVGSRLRVRPVEAYRLSERPRTDHALVGALAGLVIGSAALVIDIKHCEATRRNSDGSSCGLGFTLLPIVALGSAAVGATVGALWPVQH